MSLKNEIFSRVLTAYRAQIERENFNGIKLQEINEEVDDDLSSQTQLNPHIKRLPPLPIEKQLEKFDVSEKYHTCLYPTPEEIQSHYDLGVLNHKPFTKQIAAGAEQLKPIHSRCSTSGYLMEK